MASSTHPGLHLRDEIFPKLGLTVSDLADWLHVDRTSLSRLLNGRAGISPDMCLRLAAAGVESAEFWAEKQWVHDLAEARKRKQPSVKKLTQLHRDA